MSRDAKPIELIQISDLHLTDAAGQLSFLGRDSDASLAAVIDDILDRFPRLQLIVASGDLADQAGPAAYDRLAAALERLPVPVYCLAGNHDGQVALEARLPRPTIHVEPTTRVGNWVFVFLDSNALGQEPTPAGIWHDRAGRYLLADRGKLTPAAEMRARSILSMADGRPALLFLHHPPLTPTGDIDGSSPYVAQVRRLLADFPSIRALACGHLHAGFEGEFDGRPVFGCPSTSISVDYVARTFDAPGYRWLRLHSDGGIESGTRLLTEQYPDDRQRPVPPFLIDLMLAELTVDELRAMPDEQFEARYGVKRSAAPAQA